MQKRIKELFRLFFAVRNVIIEPHPISVDKAIDGEEKPSIRKCNLHNDGFGRPFVPVRPYQKSVKIIMKPSLCHFLPIEKTSNRKIIKLVCNFVKSHFQNLSFFDVFIISYSVMFFNRESKNIFTLHFNLRFFCKKYRQRETLPIAIVKLPCNAPFPSFQ